jgi:hypothetical protein
VVKTEDDDHIGLLLLRKHLLSTKWLAANEEAAWKKIMVCTSTFEDIYL